MRLFTKLFSLIPLLLLGALVTLLLVQPESSAIGSRSGGESLGTGLRLAQVATNTPAPEAEDAMPETPTATVTATQAPDDTPTSTPAPTDTPIAETPTPAATATETPTDTPVPTATPTNTPAPTATPTHTPLPTATPTATNTPVFILWEVSAPTATPLPTARPPIPEALRGKIIFRSDRDAWMANTVAARRQIEQNGEIFVMNPDGSEVAKLTARWPYPEAAGKEVLSEDGQFELFVRRDAKGPQIFVCNHIYQTEKQVSYQGAGASWEPAFAPGGWQIAFTSNESRNDEIWTINRDGSEARQITRNEWEWDKHASWSPDGTEIVFYSNRTGKRQIFIMNPDGSNVHLISDGHGEDWDPIWVK